MLASLRLQPLQDRKVLKRLIKKECIDKIRLLWCRNETSESLIPNKSTIQRRSEACLLCKHWRMWTRELMCHHYPNRAYALCHAARKSPVWQPKRYSFYLSWKMQCVTLNRLSLRELPQVDFFVTILMYFFLSFVFGMFFHGYQVETKRGHTAKEHWVCSTLRVVNYN
jgi:hypothetical protein